MSVPTETRPLPTAPAEAVPVASRPLPPGLTAPPGMETLWHAFRRRWLTMLLCGLVGGALAAGLACYLVPARYSATALLHVSPRARGGYESETDFLNYLHTQTTLLKSYTVLHAVLEKPGVADLGEVRAHGDPMEWLMKDLVTDTLLGKEIIRLTLTGDNPEDIAALLNELADVFLRQALQKEEGRVTARVKQLTENFRQAAERLREKRLSLRFREEQLGLEDPATLMARQQTTLQQQAGTQNQRVQLQLDLKKSEIELASMKASLEKPETVPVSAAAVEEEWKQDPAIKKQLERLGEVEENLQRVQRLAEGRAGAGALQRYQGERQDILDRIVAQQMRLRPAIEARLRGRAVEDLKVKVAETERHIRMTREQDKALEAELKRLEDLNASLRMAGRSSEKTTSDVDALRDDVAQTELLLKKIGDELGSLQAEMPVQPRVTLLEASEVPLNRKRDRQVKVAGASGFGAFGLVVLGFALLEFRARRVYSAGDVSQGLGLNLVGTVPVVPARARRPAPGELRPADLKAHAALTEAVDGLRTLLLHSARTEPLQIVMVTSAVGGEGKTSLASHLAASLARGAKRTLLIDCDLRNPAAHRQFDLPLAPGFSECLRDETSLYEAIRATTVPNLDLLPAGQCDAGAIQALAQEGLGQVFKSLRPHFDFIVLDVCPLLPVADSLLIGQHADAAVLSVLRNVSRLPAVHAAQQRLAALDIKVLGAVVIGDSVDVYGAENYRRQVPVG